jgi:hypothetical protein
MSASYGVRLARVRSRAAAASALLTDTAAGLHLTGRLVRYLRHPITRDEAMAVLRHRLESRERTFLELARVSIYANASSPYHHLLARAGCGWGDLVELVSREGLEGALAVLYRQGVYLTVDEFKGRRPLVRNGVTIEAGPSRLRNPRARAHILAMTSGSRGARTVTGFDLDFVRACAINSCLFLDARGGARWAKADWEGAGGGASFRLLKFNSFGDPLAAWFTRVPPGRLTDPIRLNNAFMRLAGQLAGVPFPAPVLVPHESPLPVAHWISRTRRSGRTPHLYGFVSSVVRLCRAAAEAGVDIRGAEFTLIGEPTTAARLATVRESGARGVPRYGSIETGPVGYGCLDPDRSDDMHLQHDRVAVIQAGTDGGPVFPSSAILLTTLDPTAPFVFVNVSMGDQSHVGARACGCPLERLGWRTHLHTILSYEKLTAAGITLHDTDVVRVLEEGLPARFGGVPTHYQLAEEEGADGQPRLVLLVHPGVGPVDDVRMIEAFLAGIGASGGVWDTPGFLRVERAAPMATASGKILHLHLWRRPSPAAPPRGGPA